MTAPELCTHCRAKIGLGYAPWYTLDQPGKPKPWPVYCWGCITIAAKEADRPRAEPAT